jgi:hypothetical protein
MDGDAQAVLGVAGRQGVVERDLVRPGDRPDADEVERAADRLAWPQWISASGRPTSRTRITSSSTSAPSGRSCFH